MNALDRLKSQGLSTGGATRKRLFQTFGLAENPFPPASRTAENPHMDTAADQQIVDAIQSFCQNKVSCVVAVEGTQGVGKTNLLNYYHKGLEGIFSEDRGRYVICYFSDLEPTFDGVMRRLFLALGTEHLLRLAEELKHEAHLDSAQDLARSHDFRSMLKYLGDAHEREEANHAVGLAIEWLTGMRLLNRHREILGVRYRLDTLESRTEAFRDLVEVSHGLGLLDGIFLLLDELEKLDGTVSEGVALKYLFALRAIIDSLPRHLFLMVALTPTARKRYFQMVPALRGRMQNTIALEPLHKEAEAVALSRFYIQQAREAAQREFNASDGGSTLLITDDKARIVFNNLYGRTFEGYVTQREFLHALHEAAQEKIREYSSS